MTPLCTLPLKPAHPTTTSDLIPPPLHPHPHSLRPLSTDAPQSSRTPTSHAYNYTCTFCLTTFSPPAHHLPPLSSSDTPSSEEGDGRILCEKCSTWTFALYICWTCGEMVVRGEERVAFGWCFWHWGCFACLFCAVPLKPPPWTDDERGIELRAPPVCRRCRSSRSPPFVPSSGVGDENQWMDSVIVQSDGDDDDDDGVEEVDRAQATVEKDSWSLANKGSGTLRRVTEEGEEVEHGMREESSVSGTVKRNWYGGCGAIPVGKKEGGEYDIGNMLKPAGDVQYERKHAKEESFEDTGRYIGADTKNNTVRKEPADNSADGPVPASTPMTYVSISAPLDKTQAHIRDAYRPFPDWISPLPSNRPDQIPSRSSSPVELTSQESLTVTTPFSDAKPTTADATPSSSEQSLHIGSSSSSQTFPERSVVHHTPTSSQLSQNPGASTTPAVDAGLDNSSAELPAFQASFVSQDYLEGYPPSSTSIRPKHAASPGVDLSPYCTTSPPSFSEDADGNEELYHSTCLSCDICSASIAVITASGERALEIVHLKGRPYHIACVRTKVPGLLRALKQKQDEHALEEERGCGEDASNLATTKAETETTASKSSPRPSLTEAATHHAPADAHALAGTGPATWTSRSTASASASTNGTCPDDNDHDHDASNASTGTDTAPNPSPTPPSSLLTKLTTLFTTHLHLLRRSRPRPTPHPKPSSPPPSLAPHCAGCRLPFLLPAPSTDSHTSTSTSVRGPLNTIFHIDCMRCATCDRVLRGGTSWFELDGEGRVEVSCRKCWRGRRFEAGWRVEEVDVCEMGLGFVG